MGDDVLSSLRIRGPFRGQSGYDHHTREFTRAIAGLGVDVQLVDMPEWGSVPMPPHKLDPWFDRLCRPVDAGMTLHFAMPHQVVSDGATRDINYTMFEATRVPRRWVGHNREHHLVIVPTESSARAWLASGYPADRVRVCPLGVDPKRFNSSIEPLELTGSNGRSIAGYRCRFLNVSETGPRKNLSGLLRAWMLATTARDDAVLIIKLGRVSPASLGSLNAELRSLERDLGKRLEDAGRVDVLLDQLSDHLMPRLYASATHYISLSHGEGWDNAMVEAAATGLRLIAPDHSAYRAYLNPDIAWMIPSAEVPARIPVDPDLQRLFQGACWWEPDIACAANVIRSIIDGDRCDRTGAQPSVTSRFRWEQSAASLLRILTDAQ